MKKSWIALCAGSVLSLTAVAQSSVTVFGLLDMRVSRTDNSGAGGLWALNHSGIGPSRWGVRGVEELGGDLYAAFHLEAQVQPDTGASNASKFWNRRSTVAIGSRTWGELRLGRDVAPSYRITTQFDPFTANGIGSNINILSAGPNANNRPAALRINSFNQVDNAINYYLPGSASDTAANGMAGQLMVAAGEGGTSDAYTGGYLGWNGDTWRVGGHAARINPAAGGTISRYDTTGVAASLRLGGRTTVMAQAQQERSTRTTATPYRETWWQLGAVHEVGPGAVKASLVRRNATGTAIETARDAQLWAVGYVHNLSRRTALYATYASLSNAGSGTYYLPNGPATIAAGGRSRGFDVGMRHHF